MTFWLARIFFWKLSYSSTLIPVLPIFPLKFSENPAWNGGSLFERAHRSRRICREDYLIFWHFHDIFDFLSFNFVSALIQVISAFPVYFNENPAQPDSYLFEGSQRSIVTLHPYYFVFQHIFWDFRFPHSVSSTSPPGGNQVDGLPPVPVRKRC